MAIRSLIFILFLYLIIKLQVKLSKNTNTKQGLIIPLITFGISISGVLNVYIPFSEIPSILGMLVPIFIYLNIPTLISLGIYAYYKNNDKDTIDKMKIKDL